MKDRIGRIAASQVMEKGFFVVLVKIEFLENWREEEGNKVEEKKQSEFAVVAVAIAA